MMLPSTCETCGKTDFYYPSKLPRRFCSLACRDEQNAKYAAAPCIWCGGPKKRRAHKFCSPSCRGAYTRAAQVRKGHPIGSPVRAKTNHTSRLARAALAEQEKK